MAWTPTAIQFQQRLNDRRSWFVNQWLFKWHQLPNGRYPVQVDLFDGRTSYMGGIEFSGTARDVYWDAITRGVRKEIVDQFAWVDEHVRRYNRATAEEAIDQCAGLLASFAKFVRREAVKKDRILRGNGREFLSENDAGQWYGTSPEEIQKHAEALKASIPFDGNTLPKPIEAESRSGQLNRLWHDNQWWIGPMGMVLGIAGLAFAFL